MGVQMAVFEMKTAHYVLIHFALLAQRISNPQRVRYALKIHILTKQIIYATVILGTSALDMSVNHVIKCVKPVQAQVISNA
jgi:hypothetical protein